MSQRYPLFVKRDLDGFFGLLIDNLVQLLLIPALCGGLCGMTGDDVRFVTHHILPGAALSILIGNVFYAWQAHRLAARTGRSDITALPYGLNTPSLFVYIIFVMAPVYQKTHSAEAAWQMGLFACAGSGVIEFLGAFVAGWIRRKTPRAALLSTLAGISIGFISMSFALQIFQRPLVAMLPLAIMLIALFARAPYPWGLPAGLVAVVAGTVCAWCLPGAWTGVDMQWSHVAKSLTAAGWRWPLFSGGTLAQVLALPVSDWIGFLSVIVPMGLFNVIGSLQNIESASASGDDFDTFSAMAANGVGTLSAALFGSCFPTTIYIGHPGWKALGARAGYSTLNGVVIAGICLTGTVTLISSLVPIEAGIAIVLWVGIIITAQAFQSTPHAHAPAVAVGLFPAIAAWGTTVVTGTLTLASTLAGSNTTHPLTLQYILSHDVPPFVKGVSTEVSGYLLHGMLLMERGYIFTCMILAAISAQLIDRKFHSAGIWAIVGALFAGLGLTHAYQVAGNNVDFLFNLDLLWSGPSTNDDIFRYRAFPIATGYLLAAALFHAFGYAHARKPLKDLGDH